MYKLKRIEKDSIKSSLLLLGVSVAALVAARVLAPDSFLEFSGIFVMLAVGEAVYLAFCLVYQKIGGIPFDEKGFTVRKKTYRYTEVNKVLVKRAVNNRIAHTIVYYYVKVGDKVVLSYQLSRENADLFSAFLKKAEVPFEYEEGFKV